MVLGSVWQRQTGDAYSPRGAQRGATNSRFLTSTTVRRSKRYMPSRNLFLAVFALFALGFVVLPSSVAAQAAKKPQRDTIVLTSGQIKVGTLKNIFGSNVYYIDTLGKERSLKERNVHRIIYSSGRTQTLNQKAISEVSDDDWRIVMLVDDPKQVEGLYARGVVSGKSSPSNKTKQSVQRSAETRIKKRCVAKGGIVVLVTKRLTTGGYGEIPSYYIEGEAYGTEPPQEGEENVEAPIDDSDE